MGMRVVMVTATPNHGGDIPDGLAQMVIGGTSFGYGFDIHGGRRQSTRSDRT